MPQNSTNKIKEFNTISNEMDNLYHKIAINVGISDSAFEILYALFSLGEGITQTEIYKTAYLNKQTINSSIKNLEKNNLIYFKKIGKENTIYLTDTGKKFVEDKIALINVIEKEVLDEMTDEEYQELIKLMRKYLEIFKEKIKNNYGIKKESLDEWEYNYQNILIIENY